MACVAVTNPVIPEPFFSTVRQAGTSPTSYLPPQTCFKRECVNGCGEGTLIVCEQQCEIVASPAVTRDEERGTEPYKEYAYGRVSHSKSEFNKYSLPQPWWEGQLAESIHNTMKKREGILATVQLASPQLCKR